MAVPSSIMAFTLQPWWTSWASWSSCATRLPGWCTARRSTHPLKPTGSGCEGRSPANWQTNCCTPLSRWRMTCSSSVRLGCSHNTLQWPDLTLQWPDFRKSASEGSFLSNQGSFWANIGKQHRIPRHSSIVCWTPKRTPHLVSCSKYSFVKRSVKKHFSSRLMFLQGAI